MKINLKTLRIAAVIPAAMIISALIFTMGCKEAKFKKDDTVAAKWTDGNYYLATIKNINGDKYDVFYADNTNGTVTEADMKVIPAKLELKAGDKVWAVWGPAKFYSAVVKEVKSSSALVAWDDGSSPEEVPFGKIMKQ